MDDFSFTKSLVGAHPLAFKHATQSPFLSLAARGQASKSLLGKWLANDRLYIHSYIRGIGRLLNILDLPSTTQKSGESEPATVRLLDWMVDAMVNIRREEKFFVETAGQYGIELDLSKEEGRVLDESKLEGLRQFEKLFGELALHESKVMPWLECAVIFWGTEKCYLDAWTWAAGQLDEKSDGSADEDGGAFRKEFIPNWTSKEFVAFVDRLGDIIDDAVDEAVEEHGEDAKNEIVQRALVQWQTLLAAEKAFWPDVSSVEEIS